MTRQQRHEPFTPRLPGFVLGHPALFGAILTAAGIAGNWWVSSRLAEWPSWMLFPSLVLAVMSLVAMVIGLGILTVRALEPLLAVMDWDWDAESLATLGFPLGLQRKIEKLGFWTAEDLVRAIDRERFPWRELEYDERMQVERAAQRWRAGEESTRGKRPARRRVLASRRSFRGGAGD